MFSTSVTANVFAGPENADYPVSVENYETIHCPFCGGPCEVPVDTSLKSQRFTTDCEVCCRPFEVTVECENGEILDLDVTAN